MFTYLHSSRKCLRQLFFYWPLSRPLSASSRLFLQNTRKHNLKTTPPDPASSHRFRVIRCNFQQPKTVSDHSPPPDAPPCSFSSSFANFRARTELRHDRDVQSETFHMANVPGGSCKYFQLSHCFGTTNIQTN